MSKGWAFVCARAALTALRWPRLLLPGVAGSGLAFATDLQLAAIRVLTCGDATRTERVCATVEQVLACPLWSLVVISKRRGFIRAGLSGRPRAHCAASVSTKRETVGSEATGPNTAGSARASATSAKQSPPTATARATSSRTLPGSCTARGLRHGASAADIAVSRPLLRTPGITRRSPSKCFFPRN